MSKYTPQLYIDTTLTNGFEYKPHYNSPYTPIQHKYKTASASTNPIQTTTSSRNNNQLYLFNSQSQNNNSDHKTDNDPKFTYEKKIINRMPSPLLRTTAKVIKVNKAPETIDINEFLGKEAKRPLTIDILNTHIDNFEPSRSSNKSMGFIKAYSANTHQGIVRNYNEDRVSIIINMTKPNNYHGQWPKISFFGIYDGHGGAACAEYLRDNLHKLISQDDQFPHNVPEAIKNGFGKAEKDFINNLALNKSIEVVDKSGSCAVVTIVIENICYIANVGDSRAIMSSSNGAKCIMITTDHKPNYQCEKNRINENGGRIYQSQTPLFTKTPKAINQVLLGPFRVFPGRLSVSRTLGDVEAKKEKFGGLPNVIIAVPEVFKYNIEEIDFIVMGCDGIFDQLSNQDVSDCAWMAIKEKKKENVHSQCASAVDMVIKASLARKSLDNVTCLMIAFRDFNCEERISSSAIDGNEIMKTPKSHLQLQHNDVPLSHMTMNNDQNNNPLSKYLNNNSNTTTPNVNIPASTNVIIDNVIYKEFKDHHNDNHNQSNSNTLKGGSVCKTKPVSKKSSTEANHNNSLNTLHNNNTPMIRSEKVKYSLNTSRYYLNNIHNNLSNTKEKTEMKYFPTQVSSSSNTINNVHTFNQFLTPANSKGSKDSLSLKKKKELTMTDPKYNSLYTENYPSSYGMNNNKQMHTMNSQRYDSKYRSKYSNF